MFWTPQTYVISGRRVHLRVFDFLKSPYPPLTPLNPQKGSAVSRWANPYKKIVTHGSGGLGRCCVPSIRVSGPGARPHVDRYTGNRIACVPVKEQHDAVTILKDAGYTTLCALQVCADRVHDMCHRPQMVAAVPCY